MGESLPGRRAISPVELLVHSVVVVFKVVVVVFKVVVVVFKVVVVLLLFTVVVVVVFRVVGAVILSELLLTGLIIFDKEIKVLFEGMGTGIHRSLLSSLCSRDRHRAWSICN